MPRFSSVMVPRALAGIGLMAAMAACNGTNGEPNPSTTARDRPLSLCPAPTAAGEGGGRRTALVVGVGDYAAESVNDLAGTVNDAWAVYDLLTGDNGYGFSTSEVCLLTDSAATTGAFEQAFRERLVSAAGPDDVVVIYFAGHGSQTPDLDGDEPDEWDETLLFHDARDGRSDLTDDRFHDLLSELEDEAHKVVILDSCNSSSATRRVGRHLQPRYQPPMSTERPGGPPAAAGDGQGDGATGWVGESIEGLVTFTAAADGTPALEKNGRGIFTSALVEVLGQVSAQPLTYAQAARQIPPLVAAESSQTPFFEGEHLSTPVFANTERRKPRGLQVAVLGTDLELQGPPLPGVGVNAELRIFDGSLHGADLRDPAWAKATVVVTRVVGPRVTVRVASVGPVTADIALGDHAVLVRPADDAVKVLLAIRSADRPGGLDATMTAEIVKAIGEHPDASLLVEVVESAVDFELVETTGGRLQLRDAAERARFTFAGDAAPDSVAERLWLFAVQRSLLRLRGEGGGELVDDETLTVRAVPAADRFQQCTRSDWAGGEVNTEQTIPLCTRWHVEVTVSDEAPVPLLVAGLLLSSDGAILALPSDGRHVLVEAGDRVVFDLDRRERFVAGPPLDVLDRLMVFGVQQDNQVPWHLLAAGGDARASRTAERAEAGSLYHALERYIQPGFRGQALDVSPVEASAWTRTTVPIRVIANADFLRPDDRSSAPVDRREYTIAEFDVRPYLPDDPEASLYRVLDIADGLARYSAALDDGIPYKQHAWSAGDDVANLAVGIDCSRATWYAFTRAGLDYTDDERFGGYLPTAWMVDADSPMATHFVSCTDDPVVRLGDVLVYRDAGRGDGHTVMVIDPEKRIAWGSHGWDGNVREGYEPDTGVEYQLIKYKQDWQRWDRSTMFRVACWRHRRFVAEAESPSALPGELALDDPCREAGGCGRFESTLPTAR